MTNFNNACDTEWADDSPAVISSNFIEYFAMLEDVRASKKTNHSLLEIIFTTVCAYICGANSWEGVLEFARAREAWLKKYISLENGIPSLITYWRTFAHFDMIRIKDCLVSIDAAGCQTTLAEKISGLGGEYLLALKGNQGILRSDVEAFFQDAFSSNWEHLDFERCESVEKGHGRIDTRTVYLVKDMADCIDNEQWPNIQSVIMVNSKRRIKDKESEESRYYITSSAMGVTEAALAIRRHWAIESAPQAHEGVHNELKLCA